jgi:predicted Zn-dependent peptidase
MKNRINIFFILALLAFTHTGLAQSQPYEMTVEGVKVIVHPANNQLITVTTVIKGGVQNYPAEKQGIESLAMNALTECGTINDDKNSFKNKLDKVSGQVYGSSNMDYAAFSMNCVLSDFNVVWPLYSDALTSPGFDEKEFNRIRNDAVNIIRDSESDPQNAINKYAKKVAFRGKNYAKDPQGTEAIVSKLTNAETKKYYQGILNRGKLLVVVVGDMDRATLEEKLSGMLKKIPAGPPYTNKKEAYIPAKSTFSSTQKELATNYIQGITGAPLPGTPDFNAYQVAMAIFSSKHFLEVRSKHGLSYAPNAWFASGTTSVTNIAVSTTEPDKYINVFNGLVTKLKKEGFSPEEVQNEKVSYVTGVYYRQETNDAQASALVNNEVQFGNWKRALTIKDEINKVTPEQVNAAFKKYMGNITWVYMGNPAKVTPSLYAPSPKPLPSSTVKPVKKN